ncbi:uncharacterized protein LOC111044512 [Nilaparvata lugens]|uniref:uncharacterized protein LOC111044512 n=1 Tax=Nilaparvata lugens TaxID=108931 RepID=UPI00193EA535|nr:uncharacterized protein LOC111044512 [Nilaparvata lugens]
MFYRTVKMPEICFGMERLHLAVMAISFMLVISMVSTGQRITTLANWHIFNDKPNCFPLDQCQCRWREVGDASNQIADNNSSHIIYKCECNRSESNDANLVDILVSDCYDGSCNASTIRIWRNHQRFQTHAKLPTRYYTKES